MTTTVKMTISELCRAVAEEMGYKINSSGMIARRVYQQGKPVDNTGFWIDPCDFMLCGDAMLEVAQYMSKLPKVHLMMSLNRIGQARAYIGPTYRKKGQTFLSDNLPTAVLLAFMKAVKGIDVEVTE